MKFLLNIIDKDVIVAVIAIACAIFAYSFVQQADEAAVQVHISD